MSTNRVAYMGHHGTTLLFLAIHRKLAAEGSVDPVPGFLTFSPYWRREIRKQSPQSPVVLFPNMLDWFRLRKQHKASPTRTEDKQFERAWKLDKILRHYPAGDVELLWKQYRSRISHFLDSFRPSVMISETIQSLPCYATYTECGARNIPFLQITGARIKNRFEAYVDESGIPYGLSDFPEPKAESYAFARSYIDQQLAAKVKRPYQWTYNPGFKWTDIQKSWQYITEQLAGGILEPTAPSFFHPFIAKWRALKVKESHADSRLFRPLSDLANIKEKKLLFPLHVTPEASTDLWAAEYSNMLHTARQIVAHLPSGWILVMKEHPSAVYIQRPRNEIEQLSKLERSLLLSPTINNDQLIEACDRLLVINSTMGLEAMMQGIPVITIGHPFYDLAGNSVPCPDLASLPEAIEAASTFEVDPKKTERFIAAYYEATQPGTPANPLLFAPALEPANVAQLAKGIGLKLETLKNLADSQVCYN